MSARADDSLHLGAGQHQELLEGVHAAVRASSHKPSARGGTAPASSPRTGLFPVVRARGAEDGGCGRQAERHIGGLLSKADEAYAAPCAALVPYKYHVAVENHIAPHHWTEKFSDAILCECLPLYAGDPALTEIFPADCFIPIPIDDPAEAVRIVKAAIANGEYEKRREAILEAKRLILKKYNFWRQVIGVVESPSPHPRVSPAPQFVYARRELRKHNPLAALEDGWGHLRRHFGV